ncbi:hypothetical protein GCM10008905_22510 [Clostridium malenominatum]|uniref:histidine kinase n=1 Tax=Clostridium malenominatum TaxID=1539 RepID=A0ABP3UC18_9CLOT
MLLKSCDILTTILQSVFFVWICNNISSKENKLSKFKAIVLVLIIFIISTIFTYSDISGSYISLVMVIFTLLSIILFYRKSILDGLLGFGLANLIIVLSSYFVFSFYQSVIVELKLKVSTELQMLLFVFIPAWSIYFLFYKLRKYFFNAIFALKNLRPSLIFVLILNYTLVLLDILRLTLHTVDIELMFRYAVYFITLVIFIFSIIYFARINDSSKEVELLNAALNNKIIELKKLKHDYGSEISSLYGLYQLGKIDRIGQLLKSIVDSYQSLDTGININVQATPLVASVLHSAVSKGIDVIAFDSADYENLSITDNDLLKVLSNIIKNSIDALADTVNPTIKFKSYNNYNGVLITILNNGPEIPKKIMHKIFETGFSTKNNMSEDRGFGLNIVSNIINQCNGKISVESNAQWTQFTIELPYKIS